MQEINNNISRLKNLVADGQTKQALELLESLKIEDKNLQNEIILLNHQYSEIYKNRLIQDQRIFNAELNRINFTLLNIIDSIKDFEIKYPEKKPSPSIFNRIRSFFTGKKYEENTVAQNTNEENSFWQKTSAENTIEAYQNYLNTYQKGLFSEDAKQRIASLEIERKIAEKVRNDTKQGKKAENIEKTEKRDWQRAQSKNTVESYTTFLKSYPSSSLKREVEQLIQTLEWEAVKNGWRKAQQENTLSAYEAYLEAYPKGAFSTEAKNAIKAIEYTKQLEQQFQKRPKIEV